MATIVLANENWGPQAQLATVTKTPRVGCPFKFLAKYEAHITHASELKKV